MSTSSKRLLCEAVVVALVTGAGTLVWSANDPWLQTLAVHPTWIAVFALTARYGPRGLYTSLGLVIATLAAIGLATGHDIDGLRARVDMPSELLVLCSALLVAWAAMAHRSRLARAAEREAAARHARTVATETLEAMGDSINYLRSRCDRIDSSVTVWRELTRRIEHGDRQTAARAILGLCEMRFGACAGAVQLLGGPRPEVLGSFGRWAPDALRPTDLTEDKTVCAAMLGPDVVTAHDVPGASASDACIAAVMRDDEDGSVVGVIALRLKDQALFREAETNELATVAEWLAPRLIPLAKEPRLRAVSEGVVR